MVADNSGKVRIECISLTGNSQNRDYMLRVYTKEIIGSLSRKVIRRAWRDCMLCRKRRLMIKDNEIRIFLKKGDMVQKYIDRITMITRGMRYYKSDSGKWNLSQRMKYANLKKISPARYYVLERMPAITSGE